MNGPFKERRPGGHVETVDVAVLRQGKELLAVAQPGKGLVVERFDLNWKVDGQAAILIAVIDPNRVAPICRGGGKASVGRKRDGSHPVIMFEGAE